MKSAQAEGGEARGGRDLRGGTGGRGGPGAGPLVAAAALAAASAGWAAFQWWELVVARRGGATVCGPGGGTCAELWDSPFASAVHAWTGLPVAGWGTAFGVAALAIALAALLAQGRARERWLAALLLAAGAGVIGIVGLVGVSLSVGALCKTCLVTYGLTAAFAVAVFGAVRGLPRELLGPGAGRAAGALAAAFVLALGPGLGTPHASEGAQAVATAPAAAAPAPASEPSSSSSSSSDDALLGAFLAQISPEVSQFLSDTLADYAKSAPLEPPSARSVIGAPGARLAIADWTDTLCPHCRDLHQTLAELRRRFGESAFTLAAHQFPLDGACNAHVSRKEAKPIRCLAARAQICAEGRPGAFDLAGKLFEGQATLDESRILELAREVIPPVELDTCLVAPATDVKLRADVDWAAANGLRGTPFLIVNGKRALPFPPLLYVLSLTRGSTSHPVLAGLPAPRPLPTE